MITLTDVRKIYGKGSNSVVALDGVTLHVPAGAIFGVLGQSGAGKSTLIRCVNLLERPTSGSVVVDGREMTSLAPRELRAARQHIGMIFQHFNLLSSRTVADNIAFPLEVVGYDKSRRTARVRELLDLVGLSDKAHAYPSQLSGGQKQRVGIARALAGESHVLLSGEATSALDPQTTDTILTLLKQLNQQLGLTILLITHQMSVVKQVCDRVALIQAGQIAEQGTVLDLLSQPHSQLARALFPRPSLPHSAPGTTLATMTLVGSIADEPILSTLARRFSVDANILSGTVEMIGQQRVGQLHVALSGEHLNDAVAYVRALGATVEIH